MRGIALLILLTLGLVGEEWCVYYATQRNVYENEGEVFNKRFPNSYIFYDGKYYRFLIGPFATKKEAYPYLKKARKYHRDAFIKKCPKERKGLDVNVSATEASHTLQTEGVEVSEVFKRQALKNVKQKEADGVKRDNANKNVDEEVSRQTLNELQKESFYRLSFYEFMNSFLYKSPYGKQESLDYRLKRLDALVEDVPYNWDLFLLGTARYSKFIDFNLVQNKELVLQGGAGLSKRLFDSGFFVKNSIKRLRERLAKSDYLNAMDRLYLYGVQIYLNALTGQKIKDLYEENFFAQKAFKEIVHERYMAKVATRVDDIDAQDDLLNIKKRLLERIYAYLYSDYLLRSSADLEVKKPLKLSWFGVEDKKKDLEQYYKNALLHSPLIASQKLKERIEKDRYVKSKYFYLPQVVFNSLIYDEYRKGYNLNPAQTATGLNYQVDLTLRIPLYNKTFLDDLQRAKVRARLERERLKTKIKDVMRDIHKVYNEIKKLQKKRSIVKKQLGLAKEKVEITKKRYVSGIGIYRDYSDAINEYLSYQEELYTLDAQILQNKIYLNLLEGIQRPYEQN